MSDAPVVTPPVPLLKAGDLVCFHGDAWLSRAIRWATADPKTGEKSVINHVATVVWPGVGLDCWIVEALNRVERHKLREGVASGCSILVFRPISLSESDVEKIVQYTSSRIGQSYGWNKLLLFLIDSLLGKVAKRDVWFARRLFGKGRLVCSSLTAEAYLSIGLAFGVESLSATPNDVFRFCVENEDKYSLVWNLTVEKS